ncbi:MAG: QueT transporter family protein [Thermodesulfobacteriota bacterium]
MKAIFTMWKNTRMIILTAVCAAIYSAALLAFKTAIPLIPGITEVRVGNIFPMTFGLLFGPAGAWGSAIGNLIGDIFGGTLTPGSIAGFVGNFLLGYLPYTLWTTLVPFHKKTFHWDPKVWSHWLTYFLIAFISSTACAVVISVFVDFMGVVPYKVLVKVISVNNTLGSFIGVILLTSVYKLVKEHLQLYWKDVMEEPDQGRPLAGPLGAWVVAIASLFGLFGGLFADLPAGILGWVSTAAILLGSLLL